MTPPLGGPKKHHVYCDESGTTNRFMVFGGIITTEDNAGTLDRILQEWRAATGMLRELKWTKVSRHKLPQYIDLVNLFFDHARQDALHFNAVVFDTSLIDYRTYHKGDRVLGFYQFYCKFLKYKFGCYAHDDTHQLSVFLDERSELTPVRLETIRRVLNGGIREKYRLNADVVRSVASKVSHESNIMQMSDVLMGAVSFHCNELHRAKGASPPKIALAAHIAKKAGLRLLSLGTNPRRADFGIWRFKFPERVAAAPGAPQQKKMW